MQAIGYGGLLLVFGVTFFYARKYIGERRKTPLRGIDGSAPGPRCELSPIDLATASTASTSVTPISCICVNHFVLVNLHIIVTD